MTTHMSSQYTRNAVQHHLQEEMSGTASRLVIQIDGQCRGVLHLLHCKT
jgi:hypothetical protein